MQFGPGNAKTYLKLPLSPREKNPAAFFSLIIAAIASTMRNHSLEVRTLLMIPTFVFVTSIITLDRRFWILLHDILIRQERIQHALDLQPHVADPIRCYCSAKLG